VRNYREFADVGTASDAYDAGSFNDRLLVGLKGDRVGNGCASIAAILNQEAWRVPERRDTYNAPMVRQLLIAAGIIEQNPRRPRTLPARPRMDDPRTGRRTRRAPADPLLRRRAFRLFLSQLTLVLKMAIRV
jgi:hypothetical protein